MNVAIAGGMSEVGKLRGAPLVIVEVDAQLAVSEWNDRAEQVFAVARGAALGRPLAELAPLHGGLSWQDALAGDDPGPRRLVVDGPAGARHLEAWVQREPGAVTLYAHDVTARVAAERRLALESTLYHAIKNNLDVGLWAVDREGDFLLGEGKAILTAGNKENQFVGLNVNQVFGPTPQVDQALAGQPSYSPPGESYGVWWETWYLPVADPRTDAAVVSISLDVTAAKRREDELRGKLELIERQQETIRELSTPIIEVWDGVLTLPIVGLVDSVRTAEIMDNLLQTVTRTRARFAILDLTGVQVVDTSTASHLIGLIQAIRLLGAEGVLTGIHPNIAQTIVGIGVDLSRVRVFATMRDALKHCIAHMPRKA